MDVRVVLSLTMVVLFLPYPPSSEGFISFLEEGHSSLISDLWIRTIFSLDDYGLRRFRLSLPAACESDLTIS